MREYREAECSQRELGPGRDADVIARVSGTGQAGAAILPCYEGPDRLVEIPTTRTAVR
jgi:hypothetical protein